LLLLHGNRVQSKIGSWAQRPLTFLFPFRQ
jgi:hypothetical protein